MNYKNYLPWALRAAALIIILLLVYAWNDARSSKDELSKSLERERLEKAGLLVEIEQTKKTMSVHERALLAENGDLKDEVDKLKKVTPTTPVEVVKWKTKIVEVKVPGTAAPRECPVPGPDGKPAPRILLVEGDKGHIEVAEVTYKTGEGNRVLVGKAFCYRDEPGPPLQLFSSVVEAPISTASVLVDRPLPRWGAGLYMGFDKDGWALGPALAFPPLHAWALQFELSAGIGLGSSGNFQGGVTGLARW